MQIEGNLDFFYTFLVFENQIETIISEPVNFKFQ